MSKGIFVFVLLVAAVVAVGGAGAASSAPSPQSYTIAFNQQSLPANVDQLVTAAGGTITTRLPQIGGLGVVSSNPNFAATFAKQSSVRAVDVSATTGLIDPVQDDTSADSARDNGGTYSPTGSDAQPMPDSLGYEQWDKKKL